MTNSIEAQTVSVRYTGKVLRLQDVSVRLESGKLTAILGPNGSGKSTLIRCLSRVLKPNTGTILLNGKNLYSEVDSHTSALSIAVIPQSFDVTFDFTCREVVAMGRSPYHRNEFLIGDESVNDKVIIDRSLNRAAVEEHNWHRPLNTLSGGERQRVMIARALAQDTPILLADEPTSALDIRHQHSILQLFSELAHVDKRTILVAMHDINLAATYADELIVLNHGKIIVCGAPATVLTEELIAQVYAVNARVRYDPTTGTPFLLPGHHMFV